MIKRNDFKKIITIRSIWSPNKNLGDRKLPNGELFSDYLYRLVFSQMKIDKLGIGEDGNLFYYDNDKSLYYYPENCCYKENTFITQQKKRIREIVKEIVMEE